ncbi:MAG: AbrB/MazE/SpoVT family DNA-binding domain-containing protein [Acidobacteriota bacterium]|nr:AbrB/MazE/SpoVT family DNA-binding domain-containing protein [Acidobacteriota bacterium]MDQ5871098.1 AbrB/MazE/SpoVT family DNA-binding domain-containing protein [Acidobacteriota bacterium]
MAQAVVSTRYQVVIPRAIRQDIGLQAGQIVQIFAKGGLITMVPDQAIAPMKGFLKGMKTDALREKKDLKDAGTALPKPRKRSGERVKRS